MSKSREYHREYYQKNKNRTRESRISAAKRHYLRNRDAEGIEQRKEEALLRKAHPGYRMWHSAKARAKAGGVEFSIDIQDIVVPEVCPILMIPLTREGSRYNSPSLDRIDNSKGYTPENIRVISHWANMRKGSLSLDEIERLYLYSLGKI